MRKKTPTNTNTATAAVNLDDDEQLVEEVTTTKRIGRERRPKPASEETITVDLEDDDDNDEVEPEFADGTLAARLFGENRKNDLSNEFCSIHIRRNPDSMNDRFLTPCGAVTNLPPLRNIELTAEETDIEERVRSTYGGGHYYFQIHYNGSLGNAWRATLADDPASVARAKAAADADRLPAQPPPPAQPVPVDPFQSMLDSMSKMQDLKKMLFGDEQERLQREIDELRRKADQAPTAEPNAEITMLKTVLALENPTLTERALESIFPADSGGHWIPETLKTVFEHKEEIGGILGGLLGAFVPKPAKPANIADMMKMQPPAGALPSAPAAEAEPAALPTSSFRRRSVAAETPPAADDGDNADEISAQISEIVHQPTPEFLASITITPSEIIDPYAIENDGRTDSEDVKEKTVDGE